MLEFVKGNFFDFDADIRVNTVNCVGVMGAGVALAFKNKFPEMFTDYVSLCKKGLILPGRPVVWKSFDIHGKAIEIINFPTKDHWRNKSKYEYIETGLIWLSEYLSNKKGLTLTLPALGCGHGGLDWVVVKNMIEDSLSDDENNILVFGPQASKKENRFIENEANKFPTLKELNVSELSPKDKNYPKKLSSLTVKNLYFTGVYFTDFDLSIISSTSPSENEKKVIFNIIDISERKGYSLLFGGSSFDKKMAMIALNRGIKTGVFLPCGIAKSAEKINSHGKVGGLTILSSGDPFVQFNKKDYLPSVFSRILLSKKTLFTTSKLQWVKKNKKLFLDNNIESYFLISESSDSDIEAANQIKSKAFDEEVSII